MWWGLHVSGTGLPSQQLTGSTRSTGGHGARWQRPWGWPQVGHVGNAGNGTAVVSGDHIQRRRARERPEIGYKGSLGPCVGSFERASSRASNDADGRARGRPEHRRRRARRRWRSVAQGEVGCGGSFGAETGAFERGHRTASNDGSGGR